MFSKIKPLLAPPIFEDETKTRTADLLNTILLTIMAAAVIFGVPLPIVAPTQPFLLSVAVLTFLIALVLSFLTQRGYVRFVSLSLSIVLMVILTPIIVNDGGIRAPAFSAYLLLIVVASLLLGGRAGVYQGLVVDAIGREEEWIQQRVAEHQNPKGVSIHQLSNGRWLRVSERKTKEGGIVGVRTDITELKQRDQALAESELHYRILFEGSPTALWELDFSEVKAFIETLRHEGISDFRAYFENHPEAVRQCAKLAKPIGMNQAMVELYQAKNKADLYGGLDKIFREDTYPIFQEELLAIAEGKSESKVGTINYTFTGDRTSLSLSSPPKSRAREQA